MMASIVAAAGHNDQPQITTLPVAQMCQIGDGQVQARGTPCELATGVPITQVFYDQTQTPAPTGAAVPQISDGQAHALASSFPSTSGAAGKVASLVAAVLGAGLIL